VILFFLAVEHGIGLFGDEWRVGAVAFNPDLSLLD